MALARGTRLGTHEIVGQLGAVGLLIIGLAAVTSVAGQQPPAATGPRSSSWRQIVTPEIIVAGNAPTGELKRMLAEVTRFRGALARMFPDAAVDSPVPTSLILLHDAQAFDRFQPRDSRGKRRYTGGYFSREADAAFIVMPVSRDDYALQTILHEYAHYFVSRNVHTPVPSWLNEGLAEFYSTFLGDYRGKTMIGDVSPVRVRTLRSNTFLPLRTSSRLGISRRCGDLTGRSTCSTPRRGRSCTTS